MSPVGNLGVPSAETASGAAQANATSQPDFSSQNIGSGVPSHSANAANHRFASLNLGENTAAGVSHSSLLDAVVGRTSAQAPGASHQAAPSSFRQPTSRSNGSTPKSFGASTEWDVLSDVSLNDREGGKGVEELQKNVDKRRSNLPQLESELAALEAQIKAAEERIAKAQSAAPQ